MRPKILILLMTATLTAIGTTAQASIIVSYSFAGGSGRLAELDAEPDEPIAGQHETPGLHVGTQFSGNGVALSKLRLVPGASGRVSDAAPGKTGDGSYLSLMVKAGPGFQFDLTGLEFNVPNARGLSDRSYFVKSSVGGFGPSAPSFLPGKMVTSRSGAARIHVDLPGGEFADVEDVELRIYTPSTESEGLLTIDDIQLNGTVVKAPEPSSFLVWFFLLPLCFALAAGWLALRWRSMRWAPATVGSVRGTAPLGGDPGRRYRRWPEHVRTAILDIIDGGRPR